MAGIASSAIIGGLGLAGSLGAGLIGSAGAGGAAAGARAAGQQAYNAGTAQIDRNTSNASPYTAGGISALSTIGSLLGYGGLSNPGGEGGTYNFTGDPTGSMFANALGSVRGLANASGVPQPTLTNYQFTPETATSNTFTSDPGYQFRMQQGVAAQDQSAAAKGTLLSGGQQQALTNFGQGLATQDYQNWLQNYQNQNAFNLQGNLATNNQNFGQQEQLYSNQQGQWNNALATLMGLYTGGNSATASLAGANTGATASAGNALVGSGATGANLQAQAGTDLASGVGSGVNNALQAYYLNQYLNRPTNGGSSYKQPDQYTV
jgi:hypothetical protein